MIKYMQSSILNENDRFIYQRKQHNVKIKFTISHRPRRNIISFRIRKHSIYKAMFGVIC